jgi:hypothetical protein
MDACVTACGWLLGGIGCILQKAVRDLEEEMQRLRREHRDAQSSLQDEYDRVYRDGVSVKQQLRAAQEREEELQNQVGVPTPQARVVFSPCNLRCEVAVVGWSHLRGIVW